MHLIFLDTEFSTFQQPKLISLGLAAVTGEEFYAELPVVQEDCSDFVRDTVVPLLGKEPNAACADGYELQMRLLTWLRMVKQQKTLTICYDYQTDWDLFKEGVGRVPDYCEPRLLRAGEINELLRWDFHAKNQLPEHHALYDAKALRYSYRPIR